MADDDSKRCRECGAAVGVEFDSCTAVFEEICSREYLDRNGFGAVHLLTVDAYTLQHSEKRGPRSNAFHLMRLCLLLEHGANPGLGQRPPRANGKAFEDQYRGFPYLEPPGDQGRVTICDVYGALDAHEHAGHVRRYAQSVWEAWAPHHGWAREWAMRGKFG